MSWDWEKLKEQQQGKRGVPPQFENIINKFSKFNLPGLPLTILIFFALFVASSMFYTVGVDEVGVVQRFGKYVRTGQPGLSFKMPTGIEKVTKVKVRRVYKQEFGFSSMRSGEKQRFSTEDSSESVSLMLTGDLNVALVPWIVSFRQACVA